MDRIEIEIRTLAVSGPGERTAFLTAGMPGMGLEVIDYVDRGTWMAL